MGKRLVAYFSASGVTKGLAEKLAEAIEADIFEIAPVEPYTEADLKWTNPLARCNRENALIDEDTLRCRNYYLRKIKGN